MLVTRYGFLLLAALATAGTTIGEAQVVENDGMPPRTTVLSDEPFGDDPRYGFGPTLGAGEQRIEAAPGRRGRLAAEPRRTLDDLSRRVVCPADAVIAGRVVSSTGVLADRENFIYTRLTVEVDRVLKGSAMVGDHVTVFRPGGEGLVAGRVTRVQVAEALPLEPGRRHLWVLRRKNDAFQTFGELGTVDLSATFARALHRDVVAGALAGITPEELLAAIAAGAGAACP